ncbi:hypothetical protein OHA91_38640 [Streptomyces erythrochromogenes]|uniref:Uncharacterized protein n=1 Tax=Streptomyces erythrochromogenes TaxID=285574 RepID=A0ABZ1QMK6_9ACTN|nr:hypothetical protein [Streptomyces erythrochromogenes]
MEKPAAARIAMTDPAARQTAAPPDTDQPRTSAAITPPAGHAAETR